MWRDIDTAPKDGTHILVARNNGVCWDYEIVWWAKWGDHDCHYPWSAEYNSYPEDRFDVWAHLTQPYAIT